MLQTDSPEESPGSASARGLPPLERLRRAYRHGRAARRLREQALLAVAGMNDGVWEWDPARREVLFSERCYRMLGYPPRTEALGDAVVVDLIHPEDRDKVAAARLAPAGSCQEYELRVRHADGHYCWMLVRGTAVPGRGGSLRSRVGFLIDVSARRLAEDALRASEERATAALAASGAALWTIDYSRGGLESFDERACEIAGLESGAEWPAGTFCGLLHPEDRPRLQAGLEAARSTGRSPLIEYRILRRDGGEPRWLQGTGALQRDATGKALRFIGVSTDITERKHAERHRELLLRELGHRVKNILSIVQSIADQTARGAESIALFQETFAQRLQALTRAHDLLMRRGWQGATLETLVHAALAPFGADAPGGHRLHVCGPPLELAPISAVSLAMALHELATNAVKYGALAVEGGEVALSWEVCEALPAPQVSLAWIERGGPPVAAPRRAGFGTRLVRAVATELGGEVSLGYPAEGFECRLRFPLSEKVSLGADPPQ